MNDKRKVDHPKPQLNITIQQVNADAGMRMDENALYLTGFCRGLSIHGTAAQENAVGDLRNLNLIIENQSFPCSQVAEGFKVDVQFSQLRQVPTQFHFIGMEKIGGKQIRSESFKLVLGFAGEPAHGGLSGGQWLAHFHNLLREEHLLKSSLSWRLTWPVRAVADTFSLAAELYRVTADSLRNESPKATVGRIVEYIQNPNKFAELQPQAEAVAADFQYSPEPETIESSDEVELAMKNLSLLPTISIVVPVYNTLPEWLNDCFQSVLSQTYPNWEICAYDDASTDESTLEALSNWEKTDARIRILRGKENVHISLASNAAAKASKGELIGLLDHDDLLTPNALWEMVKYWNLFPETDFCYSDEDKLESDGQFVEPYFKSDYNLDLLRSNNYINHFSVFRKSLFEQVGGFRKGFEGSQDHDLFLRMAEQTSEFGHIAKVLYHWRKVPGSTASVYAAKSYPEEAAIKALKEHLERIGTSGTAERGLFPGSFRLKRDIITDALVSIIIPFRDQVELLKTCIESLKKTIEYQNVEILLVNNNSEEQATQDYLNSLDSSIRQIEYPGAFNFSAINNFAVKQAKGEYILFLNNDIEATNKGWFEAMLEHIQRPEVGAVGAKLLYPDNSIQHAGVILGIGGVAGHSHKYLPGNQPGYFYRASVIQNLSACTAACLMVERSSFDEVDGFDEEKLKIAFNDIDLCLKIRNTGRMIVYTPYAELIHHESKSRGHEDSPEKVKRFNSEVDVMTSRWREVLANDPYYNPRLSLTHEDFRLKQ